MTEVLAALREGATQLLDAEGHADLARLVARAALELVGPAETWLVGPREVSATGLALALPPAAFIALQGVPEGPQRVERAFATLMDTPETKLAGLALLVQLPGLEVPYHHAYRQAPVRVTPERPDPDAVLRGALALLEARGEDDAAEVLAAGHLEAGERESAGPELLLAWVLVLPAAELARTDTHIELADRLTSAVRSAATRALVRFAGLELACGST